MQSQVEIFQPLPGQTYGVILLSAGMTSAFRAQAKTAEYQDEENRRMS